MPDEGATGGATGGAAGPGDATIEDYFSEDRRFPPPRTLRRPGRGQRPGHLRAGRGRLEGFWAEQAGALDWFAPWDTVLEWDLPFARWFVGGTLNVSYNCLDRHVAAGRGDRVAFHWEGEPGDTRTITYAELLVEVCALRQRAAGLGVGRGDRVAIYMPMIPELPVAMLACTRIGAAHSVVFGGFSPDALRDRIHDAEARVLVTADGGWRRGTAVAPQGQRRRGGGRDPVRRPRGGGRAARATPARARRPPWRRGATTGGTS